LASAFQLKFLLISLSKGLVCHKSTEVRGYHCIAGARATDILFKGKKTLHNISARYI